MTATEHGRLWTRDALAQHIESQVLREAQSSGGLLPSERSLADRLGVSRSLVREVLRGLEQRGLIEIVPGKGAYVRDPGPGAAARAVRSVLVPAQYTGADVVEALATVQTRTAELAAQRATLAEITALRGRAEDFHTSPGLVRMAIADFRLHSLVARAARNPVLTMMFESVSGLAFQATLRALAATGPAATDVTARRDLVVALENQEPAAAASAMSTLLDWLGTGLSTEPADQVDDRVADVWHRAFGEDVAIEDVVFEELQTMSAVESA